MSSTSIAQTPGEWASLHDCAQNLTACQRVCLLEAAYDAQALAELQGGGGKVIEVEFEEQRVKYDASKAPSLDTLLRQIEFWKRKCAETDPAAAAQLGAHYGVHLPGCRR